ncbi:MAG TPA: FMN-binding negative transcriptional regulator [Desulfuromonadales bacterium]|nr:FMN-binding negative transcriptional regulator [Desulfuromonadales bacterium]
MYLPSHFEESRSDVLHGLIRSHPLATVVTLSKDGINANHIPLLISPESGQFGVLRGHIARSNSMWSDLVQDVDALAIFQGPDSYISPSWYPTKQEHGKVVPTWNYAVVHAYGSLRIIDNVEWVRNLVESLTNQQEAGFSKPWAVSDAPSDYTDRLIESIVGFEIVISKLTGKWKVSQNQPAQNQEGVVKGLKDRGNNSSLEMATLIEEKLT